MKILGIETSCDETAAAIVNEKGAILSNKVLSQIKAHELYGGVVPEIAAREHITHLAPIIQACMKEAGLDYEDLDGISATAGPGLIGGVMIGLMMGKSLAAAHNLPFAAINHLEGHALSARLGTNLDFPFLLLLVSGGHTALVNVRDIGHYTTLGTTLDDALGELFDKSGKMMGLPYPGGPEVEKMARRCLDIETASTRFPLPRPLKGRAGADFSFSGLKTAIRNHIQALSEGEIHDSDISDLCACLQESVAETLQDRCANALEMLGREASQARLKGLVIAGGVAANKRLREALEEVAKSYNIEMYAPPAFLCSDNAAMIAWAGIENFRSKGWRFDLAAAPRPRWPLDELNEEL